MELKHPGSHSVVVLPDAHFPFHDKKAMSCALQAIQFLRPHRVVILGDWLDGAAFSSHGFNSVKDACPPEFLEHEVEPCRKFLDEIQKYCKELIFIEGNHENRVERWAANHGARLGPDIFKLISPQHLLGIKTNGKKRKNFYWVPYTDRLSHFAITPDLWAIHGWSTASYAAKVHQQRAVSVSVVFGHVHRAQSYARRDPVSNRILKAWSPGCLSELQASYMNQTVSDWVHGFSIVWVGSDPLDWTEYSVTIQNGRAIMPDGTELLAR